MSNINDYLHLLEPADDMREISKNDWRDFCGLPDADSNSIYVYCDS